MNQESIEEYLNQLLEESESDLDRVFIARLKAMKDWLRELYEKYPSGEGINRTEIYKYRRFEKELQFIKQNIQGDYKQAYALISGLMVSQYVENYIRSGYVYEMTTQTDMQYAIPNTQTVIEAVTNPIKELTLNATLNNHRNQVLRRIRVELAQGIQAGESYSRMAKRLEKAMGFSRSKARMTARTEAGRAQTLGRLESLEQVKKYAKTDEFWMAELDKRTRTSHRKLDGQERGKDGYFHYRGMKARGPSLWGVASMDIQCRCDIASKVNGIMPDSRRAKDYDDADYQQRLADRIDELMADEGLTEKQATRKAKRQIYPPSKIVEFQDYKTWYESLLNKG